MGEFYLEQQERKYMMECYETSDNEQRTEIDGSSNDIPLNMLHEEEEEESKEEFYERCQPQEIQEMSISPRPKPKAIGPPHSKYTENITETTNNKHNIEKNMNTETMKNLNKKNKKKKKKKKETQNKEKKVHFAPLPIIKNDHEENSKGTPPLLPTKNNMNQKEDDKKHDDHGSKKVHFGPLPITKNGSDQSPAPLITKIIEGDQKKDDEKQPLIEKNVQPLNKKENDGMSGDIIKNKNEIRSKLKDRIKPKNGIFATTPPQIIKKNITNPPIQINKNPPEKKKNTKLRAEAVAFHPESKLLINCDHKQKLDTIFEADQKKAKS